MSQRPFSVVLRRCGCLDGMIGWCDGELLCMIVRVIWTAVYTCKKTSVISYGLQKATILWFIAGEMDCLLGLQVLAPNGRLLLVANLANVDSLGLGRGALLKFNSEFITAWQKRCQISCFRCFPVISSVVLWHPCFTACLAKQPCIRWVAQPLRKLHWKASKLGGWSTSCPVAQDIRAWNPQPSSDLFFLADSLPRCWIVVCSKASVDFLNHQFLIYCGWLFVLQWCLYEGWFWMILYDSYDSIWFYICLARCV